MPESEQTTAICQDNRDSWRIATMCLVFSFLTLLVVFYQTLAPIVSTWWESGTYAHGFLILPIVFYLIWNKRTDLVSDPPRSEKRVLLLILILLLVWFSAYILNVLIIMQLAVVALIPAFVWLLLGSNIVKKLAFPLGFLFFAVPFGDFLIPSLQDITALFAVKALQLSSIPVYLEGRYFYIPSGSFEVEEGCSGVRYLIASICLGTLYSYLFYHSIARRIGFVLFCAIMPIAANAVRAYGIVMIAHLSDYKLAVGVDHILYGWLFFGVVIFFTFWIGSLFKDKPKPFGENNAQSAAGNTDAVSSYISLMLMGILMMTSSSLFANWISSNETGSAPILLKFPTGKEGWDGPYDSYGEWRPLFNGVTVEKSVQYKKPDNNIDIYVGYYVQQHQGAELISTRNQFFDPDKWKRLSEARTEIKLGEGNNWQVKEIVIRSEQGNRILWYWYDVGGYYTARDTIAKMLELPKKLFSKKNGSTVFIISTKYQYDLGAGRRDLTSFLSSMLTSVLAVPTTTDNKQ